MKITEMNNCIEEMRECYKFDDDKTEIRIGDMMSGSIAMQKMKNLKKFLCTQERVRREYRDLIFCVC